MRGLRLFIALATFIVSLGYTMRRSSLIMRTFLSENKDPFKSAQAFKMPSIILINPFLDQNVGSVSRAMLNFGLTDLRIVNPECDIFSEEAKRLAVGSVNLLENAKIFTNIADAVQDLNVVIATTARGRDNTMKIHSPKSAAIESFHEDGRSVGIMFGREKYGLTNEELNHADSYLMIPAFEEYSVLNLAQAVNIICYEMWQQRLAVTQTTGKQNHESAKFRSLAARQDIDGLMKRVEEKLTKTGYLSRSSDDDRSVEDIRRQYFTAARQIIQRVSILSINNNSISFLTTRLLPLLLCCCFCHW